MILEPLEPQNLFTLTYATDLCYRKENEYFHYTDPPYPSIEAPLWSAAEINNLIEIKSEKRKQFLIDLYD